MIARHQVRQVVVQFLYSIPHNYNYEINSNLNQNAFWDIILEKDRNELDKARVKAISHLTRFLDDPLNELSSYWLEKFQELSSDPSVGNLRDSLDDLVQHEFALSVAVLDLKTIAKNPASGAGQTTIESAYTQVQIINSSLLQIQQNFIQYFSDFPQYRSYLDPLKKIIKKLHSITLNIYGIEHPEGNKNAKEWEPVTRITQNIHQLREECSQLINAILKHLQDLDQTIQAHLKNFAFGRLNPTDLAILRLATYELKYRHELPVPIIVKESTRLAKEYSTSDSPQFISGVLGSIILAIRN